MALLRNGALDRFNHQLARDCVVDVRQGTLTLSGSAAQWLSRCGCACACARVVCVRACGVYLVCVRGVCVCARATHSSMKYLSIAAMVCGYGTYV